MLWIEIINIVLRAYITYNIILVTKENQWKQLFHSKKNLGGFKLNNSQRKKSIRIELKFIQQT